jgi:RNA polymerase sigma-70 factor (ECF subfamily)
VNNNPSDEVLIRASQRGDRAAFEQLVRRSARLVYVRLYVATGRNGSAEDLTQETFLSAWRSIGQLSEPARFRAWLLTIASSVAADALRKNARLKRVGATAETEVLNDVADHSTGPAVAAEQREEIERAVAALRALPEPYQLPLMLRYAGGADYQTMSRELGLSNGSLRGLLGRGMAMLRQRMKEHR